MRNLELSIFAFLALNTVLAINENNIYMAGQMVHVVCFLNYGLQKVKRGMGYFYLSKVYTMLKLKIKNNDVF